MAECKESKYKFNLPQVCELAKIEPNVIFYDNFECGFDPSNTNPLSHYSFLTTIGSTGTVPHNDAAGGVDVKTNSLTITSVPFTQSFPNLEDHYKYVVVQKRPYTLPRRGELVYESVFAAQQVPGVTGSTGATGVIGNPLFPPEFAAVAGGQTGINNANNDIRPGFAGIFARDPVTNLFFALVGVNETLYALYGRDPNGKPAFGGAGPDYYAFLQVVEVGKRNQFAPIGDFIKGAIAFNYHANTVRFIINDIPVLVIERLGLPLSRGTRVVDFPGPALLQRPNSFYLGFGTFDWLDASNPSLIANSGLINLVSAGLYSSPQLTDVNGAAVPQSFMVPGPDEDFQLFGQGAILNIRYLAVYVQPQASELVALSTEKGCKTCPLVRWCDLDQINGVNSRHNLDAIKSKCEDKSESCKPCKKKCDSSSESDSCGCDSFSSVSCKKCSRR